MSTKNNNKSLAIQSDTSNRSRSEFRILVVDDDPAIVNMVIAFLKIEGYQITYAMDGEAALKQIDKETRPDLLLLDIMMPKIDGLNVCKTVRKNINLFELPILIMSALSDSKDIAMGLELGANDYITKPINRIELLARIKSLLSLKQLYELAKANERLATRHAHYDDLTGLPNRTLFNIKIQDFISAANREGTEFAVLFVNINRFKSINDSLGHGAGDIYLRDVSSKIQSCISKEGFVARLHTDVFAIVLSGIKNTTDIKKIIEKHAQGLLKKISEPIIINKYKLALTANIGISLYPEDAKTTDEIIRNVDSALYFAKDKGKNSYVFFTPKISSATKSRFKVEHKLQKALENEEFILYYQPQIDIKNLKMVGVEALLRWKDPDEGIINPAKFIPVAEDSGMIIPISEWILNEVCKQSKIWQKMGIQPVKIGVNLSPQQFHKSNLVKYLDKVLSHTEIDAQQLDLEITESSIMTNMEEGIKVLEQLREMGVFLSVDDFGTGYSSLNYLKQFPIHTLKIDQSFVCDIGTNPQNSAIVSSIITLAHSLNLNVIAEGVETKEQLDYLRDNYCNEIQGYIFSRPISTANLTHLLKSLKNNTTEWSDVVSKLIE